MKWVLIHIFITSGSIEVNHGGTYAEMTECFAAREELKIVITGDYKEVFPPGHQAVCIRAEVE